MLESLGAQRGALQPQLEGFEQDVIQLKEWASGLTEKRAQLQTSLSSLRDAVGQIEERTSTITNDISNKVCQIVLRLPKQEADYKCMKKTCLKKQTTFTPIIS